MSTLAASPAASSDTGAPAAGAATRIANLDILRALAAMAVLVAHAYSLGGRGVPVKAAHFYDVPLISLTAGVWLFFALSGYVIPRPFLQRLLAGERLPGFGAYARRRAARIFPLFWVAMAAFVVIDGGHGTLAWQYPFHILLLNNLVPGRQAALYSVAWTLTLEVLFYAAVPLLAALIARLRPHPDATWLARAVVISWGLSIAFTLVADLLGDGRLGLWLRGSFPAMWQMFCPGLLLAIAPYLPAGRVRRWLTAPESRRTGWRVAVGACLLAGALLGAAAPLRYGVVAYQVMVDAARPLFAVGFGLIVAATIAGRPWRARGLIALGVASYGIYLLHPVIAAFLVHTGLVPVPKDTLAAFVLHALLLAALTVPLALASWRWLERPVLVLAGGQAGNAGRHGGVGRGPQSQPSPSGQADDMRAFWNARAREDAFYFVDTRQSYRRPEARRFWDAEPLVDYVLEGLGVSLNADDVVLEIGCGLGRMTRVMAGRAREVIALDVSDEMLARARTENAHLDNVRWVQGDGVSLAGLADGSVGACVSTVVLQHVPDPEITLGYVRELGRVLRPGGWAALQVSNDPAVHRPRDPLRHRLLASVGRAPAGQRHPAWLGSHVEIPEVRAVAGEAGLELERVWGEGSQYCQLLLRRPAPRPGR